MSAQDLIDRLEHVRQSGLDSWVARCPAHADTSPSLSITDKGDGRTLIHCHAGCGALDVLTAVGLEWDALYPPTDRNYAAERRQQQRSIDELTVEIGFSDMAKGRELTREDRDRVRDAMTRLDNGDPGPEGPDMEANALSVAKRYAKNTEREMRRLDILTGRNG